MYSLRIGCVSAAYRPCIELYRAVSTASDGNTRIDDVLCMYRTKSWIIRWRLCYKRGGTQIGRKGSTNSLDRNDEKLLRRRVHVRAVLGCLRKHVARWVIPIQ